MSAPPVRSVAVSSTDGVTLAVHDHGGDGPPLLCCHATGFHGRCWDPVIAHLTDRWRCVALDFRGHGDSTVPVTGDLQWWGMREDVLAVVDAFGFGSDLCAVGHSMGGAAVIMAEQARPGTVARAWLFEPIVIAPGMGFRANPDENPLAAGALRRREVFASRDEAYERYSSRPPLSSCDPAALRAYVDHGFADQADGTVILKCRGATEAAVFSASVTDAFDHLPEVTAEITVAASGDGGPPALNAPHVADALPRGRTEYYADLTHFAPLEDPARIAAAIEAALRPIS